MLIITQQTFNITFAIIHRITKQISITHLHQSEFLIILQRWRLMYIRWSHFDAISTTTLNSLLLGSNTVDNNNYYKQQYDIRPTRAYRSRNFHSPTKESALEISHHTKYGTHEKINANKLLGIFRMECTNTRRIIHTWKSLFRSCSRLHPHQIIFTRNNSGEIPFGILYDAVILYARK